MKKLELLKEDVIDRYNVSVDALFADHIDTLGFSEELKRNFRLLIENLVSLSLKEGFKNGQNNIQESLNK